VPVRRSRCTVAVRWSVAIGGTTQHRQHAGSATYCLAASLCGAVRP
jgi:hypothetical protein